MKRYFLGGFPLIYTETQLIDEINQLIRTKPTHSTHSTQSPRSHNINFNTGDASGTMKSLFSNEMNNTISGVSRDGNNLISVNRILNESQYESFKLDRATYSFAVTDKRIDGYGDDEYNQRFKPVLKRIR